MNHAFRLNAPLQSILWPEQNSLIKQSLLILAGVIILAISSQLTVPLKPVPITFQSATVVLIGMSYGARLGSYTILSYLLAGALGLPVFADFHFGIAELFSPRGGYLLGFVPAAFLSGLLAQKGYARNFFMCALCACLGDSFIFLFGVAWLATYVGWHNAFLLGVLPFTVAEPIKLLTMSTLIPKLWKK